MSTADNDDGNKADAIANVVKIAGLPYKPPIHPHRARRWTRVCQWKILQLCRRLSRSRRQTQRARVGACQKIRVFLVIARVIGQAATTFSRPTPVLPISVIASRNAVRPCDASANASCVGTRGVAVAASHGRCDRVPVPIGPPNVAQYVRHLHRLVKLSRPENRERSGRGGLPSPRFLFRNVLRKGVGMLDWQAASIQPVLIRQLGEHYHRYRLSDADAEADMVQSLHRYGQLSPVTVCLRQDSLEVVDGFKRLAAADKLGWASLSVRLLAADEQHIKAAIYGLNCTGQRTQEWEEAWIVHALVREDGLTQAQVAELLGRHKSWVCRRLALVEKLDNAVQADLRLGMVSPTAARALVRLPAGNQAEMLTAMRAHQLTAAELDGVVDLFLATTGRRQQEYLLAKPRQALEQAHDERGWAHDPRLTKAGNRVARRLHLLLELLAGMESWLVQRGRADLSVADRCVLLPAFQRLARDCTKVATETQDYLGEDTTHDRATA